MYNLFPFTFPLLLRGNIRHRKQSNANINPVNIAESIITYSLLELMMIIHILTAININTK